MSEITMITSKDQFQSELASDSILVMDFYAEWCGPCKMLAPIMEELQSENQNKKVKILKIDVDKNPDLAAEYGVTSIPTVFFAQGGEVKEGIMGVNPKDFYQSKIDSYLATPSPSDT
jgi:thioredoxin 1